MKVLEAFGEPIADGGQESFVFSVIERMDMTGLQIDCLTAYDCRSEHYRQLLEEKGGKIYSLDLPFTPGKSRSNIKAPFKAFLRDHHYDVVHIHSGSISVLAIMAEVADKAGVKKVIVHSHCTGEKDDFKHRVLRKMASFSLRKHADVYCACSREAAEWKFEPRYANQALIVKNGIDAERFRYDAEKREQMRRQLGLADRFVVGHVGRFSRQKNHTFLVSIFEAVRKKCPEAHLLLVGAGDEMEHIRELVKSRGLAKDVTFAGSVTNVEDYLQAMDVFAFPSLYEGLGIVAIEAQCAGLPVVASDVVPGEVKFGDVHFLPLSSDIEQWADAVLRFRGKERTSGDEGIRKAGFDSSEVSREVEKLYRS